MINLGRIRQNILTNHVYYYKNMLKLCRAEYNAVNDDDISSKRPMVTQQEMNHDFDVLSDDLIEPTTCCMSGCPNCVWIQYAEKLSKQLNNSSDEIQKVIMNKVTDPNMKAFLSMELRCRNLT